MSGLNSDTNRDFMMESYYKLVGEAHIENIVGNLASEANEIDKVKIPKSLDIWFDSFRKKREKELNRIKWIRRMKKMSTRAAVFALLIVVSMTIATFSVDAFRVRFLNFFMDKNDTYTELGKVEDSGIQTDPNILAESYYYFTYLPESYTFEKSSILNGSILIIYSDGKNKIYFDQIEEGADYQIDTEEASVREVPIGDEIGQLIIKDNRTMLFWYSSTTSFIIKGSLSEQEIVKMAESLKKNK